ncbi:MAG TPA: hypothetical protein VMZ73_09325, partial [Acidimicrobiales bacterium]|nr:hypothetical protein [Acidimicrobiales bacterium]
RVSVDIVDFAGQQFTRVEIVVRPWFQVHPDTLARRGSPGAGVLGQNGIDDLTSAVAPSGVVSCARLRSPVLDQGDQALPQCH